MPGFFASGRRPRPSHDLYSKHRSVFVEEDQTMPAKRLQQYLDQQGVKYRVISHSPAFTAQEVAETAHIPGRMMAKVVSMTLDGQMAMVVVPAPKIIHPRNLARSLAVQQATLLHENDFREKFPDCEVGALPPFGNL